jgi:hypothetical protein
MQTMSREQIQQEALTRAVSGQALTNWPAIFAGFTAKGIPESEIKPRENVFTYHAWRALGRQVRRGEHGVRITTWAPVERKERDTSTGEEKTTTTRRCVSAVVFHVSQTEPIKPQNS